MIRVKKIAHASYEDAGSWKSRPTTTPTFSG